MYGALPSLSHSFSVLPKGVHGAPPPFFKPPHLSNPPAPPIYDYLLAITPSHGGLGVVNAKVISTVRGGPALCTLPPAIKLLNIWAIPCPFRPVVVVVDPCFARVALGSVFGRASPDIVAAMIGVPSSHCSGPAFRFTHRFGLTGLSSSFHRWTATSSCSFLRCHSFLLCLRFRFGARLCFLSAMCA